MNIDAFRYIRRGIPLSTLSFKDRLLLAPVNRRNGKKERALLLLHGFSSSPAVFRELLPMLTHAYDAVICPVLPGHADDLPAFAQTKADEWLILAEQYCAQLVAEFKQVEVMGLSLGGLLACHLSRHFPLHHLYLLAPALDLQLKMNRTLKLARFLNRLGFSYVRSAAGNLYSNKHGEIAYRALPIPAVIEILTFVKYFQFSLPECPTDLFLGRHDKVIDCEQVAARFAHKKNITTHWLENSAHIIPLDSDIDSLFACIKQNLESA